MKPTTFVDEYIKPLSTRLAAENKNKYIAGDFNLDLLKVDNHKATFDFLGTMMSDLLLPSITIPTRLNPINNTLIDNIFTNDINPGIKSGNLTVGISDHLPSFIIIPKKNHNHIPKNHNIYKRDLRGFDREGFVLDYLSIDWDQELKIINNDTDYSTSKFFSTMDTLMDRYIPVRKVTNREYKSKYKPWITTAILNKIRERNKILNKYTKCKNQVIKPTLHREYTTMKNEITSMTRKSKKEYYDSYFTKHKHNLQKTWQGIKEIINTKNKNSSHPTCIIDGDDGTITDPTEIANKFNQYYTSVADNILKKRKFNGNKSFRDYLQNLLNNSFTIYECTET